MLLYYPNGEKILANGLNNEKPKMFFYLIYKKLKSIKIVVPKFRDLSQ